MQTVIDRIMHHPRTTLGGVALGAIFWYILGSWHCQMPQDMLGWIKWATVAGPVILGMLGKDK